MRSFRWQANNVRSHGAAYVHTRREKRDQLLLQQGFRKADQAEYAFLPGCLVPFHDPQALSMFANILNYYGVDYSLLQNEHCCGVPLFWEAIQEHNQTKDQKAQIMSEESVRKNISQFQQMGANKVVTFCAGCDMTYHRYKSIIPQEVIWYPTMLDQIFKEGKLDLEVDYYAGCYWGYKTISQGMPDLDSPLRLFERIKGLRVHHLDDSLCCTRPEQIEALAESLENRTLVYICHQCGGQLQKIIKKKGIKCRVMMLPDLVWAAINRKTM
jgi:Fe-S oxidoreductase